MSEKDEKLNKGSFLYINDKEKAEWGYPEGYPWKEETLGINIEWDGNTEGLYCVNDQYYLVSNEVPNIELIKKGTLNYSDDSVFNMIDLWAQMEQIGYITDSFILGPEVMIIFIKKPNIVIKNNVFEKVGIYFEKTANYGYTKSFTIPDVKTIYPIAAEFLPLATPTAVGTIKQAAAVVNVTAAPTAEEFNALLKSLRDAGILATE